MGSKKNTKKNKGPMDADKSSAAQGSVGGHGGKKISTDPRFASVHLDPRFSKLPKHKAKVTIDSRFDKMFTDKNFASSTAQIDKRGKAKKDSSRDALKHYYRLEEEEEREKPKEEIEDEEVESDEREGQSEKPSMDLSDLEMGTDSDASESDEEEENNEETTDTEEEYEEGLYSEEEDTFVPDENVPIIDKETHRLAIVNLDWGRVKAVDLFVLLSSFVRKGGQVSSVTVYPSEFGLQRMEEEAKHGPVSLFDDKKDKSRSDDEDDDDEIDNEKLREYERSRLRYYYAVVECDSVATADHLYKTCDGLELEQTSNKLDLRFIPDSMAFKHPPRDVAKEAPANYERIDFATRALQMSKIELTWDEDEPQRTRSLKRKFNDEQLADLEMKEYLASDESETDEDENNETAEQSEKKHKGKDKYRALLQSGEGSDDGDDDGDQDMEVTFNTGLEDLSKRILEKKDSKSETVWEQHLRRMKEKKKARKNRSKDSSEDESDDDDVDEPEEEMDDFFVDESSVKSGKAISKQKGKKNKVDKEAEEKSRAELELLLADENGGAGTDVKGYNMKPKKVKGKKGKEIPDGAKIPTIDYEDPRFSSLFTSSLFALDPTDPQFKRSATYARQLTRKQHMGKEEEPFLKPHKPAQLESDDVEMNKKKKKEKHELSSLVKSIKMKSKQVRLLTNDNVSSKVAKKR